MLRRKAKYISTLDAAKLLGFSHDHVRNLLRKGVISGLKVGKFWIVNTKDIQDVKRRRHPRKEIEHGTHTE